MPQQGLVQVPEQELPLEQGPAQVLEQELPLEQGPAQVLEPEPERAPEPQPRQAR